MSTGWLIAVFVLVFVGIAVAIVRLKLNPALALLIGTVVLGLATGTSATDVVTGLNQGFGGLMAEVGLLISLGVIMGLLMSSYGAVQRIVEAILRLFGRRGAPYAFGLTLSGITPAIYFDVQLVLVAPIARTVARRTGRPMASLAGPVAMGLAAGNGLVIPGFAMLAYLGAVGLSPTDMLLPGFAVALPAVAVTIALYLFLVERMGWWNAVKDEEGQPAAGETTDDTPAGGAAAPESPAGTGSTSPATGGGAVATEQEKDLRVSSPPLGLALAPILVVLLLIVAGILAPQVGLDSSVLEFLGSPVIALLAGALTALGIVTARGGLETQSRIVEQALETVGTILVVTAVAGSLGTIIAGTGMQSVLEGLFEANATLPLLIVWVIAAVLRMAIGGQTVSGLTAIGIIAPLIDSIGLSPVLVVLAAGAGGCFGGQFSDNAFWMMRSLFGLTTRGTLKTYTLAQSLLSIVVLAVVLLLDLVI